MIRNLFILAYRYLLKYKTHTFINIAGLAIGFTAFILVSLFVNYENNWDKYNTNYDRIYRVQRHFVKVQHSTGGNNISPHSLGITARLLYPKYPEIESTVILKELRGQFIGANQVTQSYDNKEGIASEQSLLQVFTYHFIAGDKNTALIDPYSIVLSETMAQKLFGSTNVVGKTVIIEKKISFKVTGVFRDLPQNSSVKPSYIVSLSTLEQTNENVRNNYAGSYMTFVLLKPGQDYKELNKKIWDLFKDNKNHEDEKIKLCPMSRLYMRSNDQTAYTTILYLYQLIGIFILTLSAFNYINLNTAKISVRAKEIGVRKVNGCNKGTLIAQFLGETLLMSIVALNLAFFLTELFLPTFNFIVQKPLSFSFANEGYFMLKVTGIALITGFVSGVYPAFFMSSQKIVNLFKGNMFKTSGDRLPLKKVLVTAQFSISIFLIILSLGFTLQIRYMLTKDLGFNKDDVLYAIINVSRKDASMEMLRNRMLQHSEITNCAVSRHVPFVSFGGGTINWEGGTPGDVIEMRNNEVSYDFVKTLNMTIIEGRDFSREFSSDKLRGCLINETAKRYFGYENPIGKRLDNGRLTIVGVTKDFHHTDMFNIIEPAIMELTPDSIRTGIWTFSFRIKPDKLNEAQKSINTELEAYFPNDPFDIQVLSETFRSENVFKILNSVDNSLLFFTVLNVLLAIMGLLGLVSFTTERRTKEIGVRKINGSSSVQIFLLLTKEYVSLLLIASLISWPCGYLGLLYLPANYKMSTPYWIFAFATLVILVIALATSCYHTLKAANTSPIKSLRYE